MDEVQTGEIVSVCTSLFLRSVSRTLPGLYHISLFVMFEKSNERTIRFFVPLS